MPLRVSIIGLGDWGRRFLERFSGDSRFKVAAVWDRNPRNSSITRSLLKKSQTSLLKKSEDEVFRERFDLLCIFTSASGHFSLAKRGLNSGSSVLVAKPFTGVLSDATRLVDLAAKTGREILVENTYLFSPRYRLFKKYLQQIQIKGNFHLEFSFGDFGRFPKDIGIFPHILYHGAYMLIDSLGMPKIKSCRVTELKRISPYFSDYGCVYFKNIKGYSALLSANMNRAEKARTWQVSSPDGFLVWNDSSEPWLKKVRKSLRHNSKGDAYINGGMLDLVPARFNDREPISVEIDHIYNVLRGKEKAISNGLVGLRALQLLDQFKRKST